VLPGELFATPADSPKPAKLRGGLLLWNGYGLRSTAHGNRAPRYDLIRHRDDLPTDLLVDANRIELDCPGRHVEARQEKRKGRAAVVDRHLNSHGQQAAESGGIGVDFVRLELFGHFLVLVGYPATKPRIGALGVSGVNDGQ
jgi:hypothetical protein